MRNGGASTNIDQTRIDQLMSEAQVDFIPWRISLCADPAIFVEDATHHSLDAGLEDASLKSAHGSSFTNVINVYVVNTIINPSAGGYAYMPFSAYGGTNSRGGVVLARGNMFVGTHTVAHELGHLAANSASENAADKAAREYRKRLKDARKPDVH